MTMRKLAHETSPYPVEGLTVMEVADAIQIPTSDWIGNCYLIAHKIVESEIVDGRAVYGHWLGGVATMAPAFASRGRNPFVAHGWIRLPDGRVLDPTRWVFEAADPYLYVGTPGRCYDEGGNEWRMASMRSTPPPYDTEGKDIPMQEVFDAFGHHALSVLGILGGPSPNIQVRHIFWLANRSPESYGVDPEPIYRGIVALGHEGFIPLDNHKRILGD